MIFTQLYPLNGRIAKSCTQKQKKMIKKVMSSEKDKIFRVCEAFYR